MVRSQEYGLNQPAPTWHVAQWFNASNDVSLEKLRGRVIALHTFQMLCPACVAHGIPQAQRLQKTFAATDLAVVDLHTVFEHHDALRPHALQAFPHEYRVNFPLGVDAHGSGQDIPLTMHAYRMHGTPTLILIDRFDIVRYHVFGRPDDMSVGAQVAMLLSERVATGTSKNSQDVKQETRRVAVMRDVPQSLD